MDEEEDFILPSDEEIGDGIEEEEDPLTMDGFHEEGAEPETDF